MLRARIGALLLLVGGVLAVTIALLCYLFRDAVADASPLLGDWPIALLIAPMLLFGGVPAIVSGLIHWHAAGKPVEDEGSLD